MTVIIIMSLLLPVLLGASAFFSGSETALFSLSKVQQTRITRGRSVVAGALTRLLGETRGLLITLLLGNMTVNVLYFTIGGVIVILLEEEGLAPAWLAWALSVVPLVAIILLGEVMPKLVASKLPMVWARVIAVPMLVIHRIITPVRAFSSWFIIGPLARLISPPTRPPELSADELGALLDLSRRHGVIDRGEQELLQQVLELGELKVRDLMVPRVDVEAFDVEEDLADLIELIRRTRLRYVPIYRQSVDAMIGVVASRKVLLHRPATPKQLQALVEEPLFVPEQQGADRLLVELRQRGRHFAVVVDEYGGTAGLITIEDVLEEIVGEIADEHEEEEESLVEIGEKKYLVNGLLRVETLEEKVGIDIQGEHYETVAGLIFTQAGRVPKVGETIRKNGLLFEVDRADRKRIYRVLISPDPEWQEDDQQEQRAR